MSVHMSMHMSMRMSVYVPIHLFILIHTHICRYTHVHPCLYTCRYTHVFTHMSIHMSIPTGSYPCLYDIPMSRPIARRHRFLDNTTSSGSEPSERRHSPSGRPCPTSALPLNHFRACAGVGPRRCAARLYWSGLIAPTQVPKSRILAPAPQKENELRRRTQQFVVGCCRRRS